MRVLPAWLACCTLTAFAACGKSESDPDPGAAAGASGSGATTSGGSGGADDRAGSPGAAGSTSRGGAAAGEGGASRAGAGGFVDCNPVHAHCRRLPPECESMHVPSIDGTCWGPCVKIDSCGCTSAAECPEQNSYTCWARAHCGPYVQ